MLTINTNLSSLIAQSSLKTSTSKLNQAIERMTTGFKINHASDNAANYSIATNMTTKINSYMVAEDNAAMGLDLISTAEGTLNQIQDKLERLRALQEQASNGTYGEQSLKAINAEANALVDEINRLYTTAEYNGINLFAGEEAGAVGSRMSRAGASEHLGFIKPITQRDTSAMTELTASTTDLTETTYKITSAEGLAQLANLVNSGVDTTGKEFVLANDIDLSGIANWNPIGGYIVAGADAPTVFSGTFDGNGYTVSNLKHVTEVDINTDEGQMASGLFGAALNANIKNVAVADANVEGYHASALVGYAVSVTIENCSTSGSVYAGWAGGGIAGVSAESQIKSSYSSVNLHYTEAYNELTNSVTFCASGMAGYDPDTTYNNCYYDGTIYIPSSGEINCGGIGYAGNANNCYFLGSFENCPTMYDDSVMMHIMPISMVNSTNSYYIDGCVPASYLASYETSVGPIQGTAKSRAEIEAMLPTLNYYSTGGSGGGGSAGGGNAPNKITLQVGIGSDEHSRIDLKTAFALNGVNLLRDIGLDTTTDYLSMIDDMLAHVSEKQTHFGAVSNRLESVLEEITIQRDNLVASRSTLRDADIAEVSSTYIQQQILQQASATLLATANQSPSIALQLI